MILADVYLMFLDKGRFKKVTKKSRNYRRRSATPEKVTKERDKDKERKKDVKKVKKYPKNWKEFKDGVFGFDLNHDLDLPSFHAPNEY